MATPSGLCPQDQSLLSYLLGSDSAVSHQAVASHVIRCSRCQSRVAELRSTSLSVTKRTAVEGREAEASVPDSKTHTLAPDRGCPANIPDRIAGLPIIRRLGYGGFSEVFLANHPTLDKLVVIKIPRRDRPVDQQIVDSFFREAATIALLRHNNIVRVLDWGKDDEVGMWVVLDYVPGGTLTDEMMHDNVSVSRAVDIVIGIAEALDFAHRRDIFHRDVKPGNILLDGDKRPLLADFGLALHDVRRWERFGEFAGTASYMSPEQLQGDMARLDGRTDIWSLGVIFYELLTGRRPFQGGSIDHLREEIANKPPRPPHSIRDNVPRELSEICLRCLQKEVQDRFASAKELADALRVWQRKQRRAPRRAIAVTAAILLAIAGYVGWRNVRDLFAANRSPAIADSFADRVEPRVGVPLPVLSSNSIGFVPGMGSRNELLLDQNQNQLMIVADGTRLVDLGELVLPDYRINIELSQLGPWSGEAGVYWNAGEVISDSGELMRQYQVVVLAYDAQRQRHVLRGEILCLKRLYRSHPDQCWYQQWETEVPAPKDRADFEIRVAGGVTRYIAYQRMPVGQTLRAAPTIPTAAPRLGLVAKRGTTILHGAHSSVTYLKGAP